MNDQSVEAFLNLRIGRFLDDLESEEPLPAAGATVAFAAASAASVVVMAARTAGTWDGAAGAAAQAQALRARLVELAIANTQAYAEALAAMRLPPELASVQRDAVLGRALARAAELPLRITESATDVAELAAVVAGHSSKGTQLDAISAAALAEGAARAAALLVERNLATVDGDDRSTRARLAVDAAADARARAAGVG